MEELEGYSHIGLSLVRLKSIELDSPDGAVAYRDYESTGIKNGKVLKINR